MYNWKTEQENTFKSPVKFLAKLELVNIFILIFNIKNCGSKKSVSVNAFSRISILIKQK